MAFGLMFLGAALGAPFDYWLSYMTTSNRDRFYDVAVDSDGNSVSVGDTLSTTLGGNNALIVKHDQQGNVLWQKAVGSSASELARGVAVDASNNIYVSINKTSTLVLVKYSPSGVLQWQRAIQAATSNEYTGRLAVDSVGNIYLVNHSTGEFGTAYDIYIFKYNSSGVLQWQRKLGNTNADFGTSVAIDSADNIYVSGYTQISFGSGTSYKIMVAKLNSSGSLQWERSVGGDTYHMYGNDIAVDENDDVVVVGYKATGQSMYLAKFNSSGTVQWQRAFGVTPGTNQAYAVTTDSANNIYAIGLTVTAEGLGAGEIVIVKYSSSGTLQWQRILSGSDTEYGYGITVDSNDNLVIAAHTVSSAGLGDWDALTIKLPNDGNWPTTINVNGTPFVYKASSSPSNIETSTSVLSGFGLFATSSKSEISSTLTDVQTSLINYNIGIG